MRATASKYRVQDTVQPNTRIQDTPISRIKECMRCSEHGNTRQTPVL